MRSDFNPRQSKGFEAIAILKTVPMGFCMYFID